MKKYYILLFLSMFTTMYSQTKDLDVNEVKVLPMGFRDIVIGLTLDQAKKVISEDGYFDYRGDPDVSMLLTDNRSIIESEGSVYIDNGYFQFYNDTLYTITLILDKTKIDFYTMFTTLTDRYGKHNSLSPSVIMWENDDIRITLEKPLTIKYVGLNIYNNLIESDTTEKAIQEKLREDFIGEF